MGLYLCSLCMSSWHGQGELYLFFVFVKLKNDGRSIMDTSGALHNTCQFDVVAVGNNTAVLRSPGLYGRRGVSDYARNTDHRGKSL
jgi:hypothetical protein